MQISQKRRELLIRILGQEKAERHIASLMEKWEQLREKKRGFSGGKLLVEAPQKKTVSYSIRKEDIKLFRAIRSRLLLRAMGAIDDGASPKAVYHHPAKEKEWSFCPQYEGKTALQVAVLEQSFEPNDAKRERLQSIIDFLQKK